MPNEQVCPDKCKWCGSIIDESKAFGYTTVFECSSQYHLDSDSWGRHDDCYNKIIAQQGERIGRLEKDKERLDWLGDNPKRIYMDGQRRIYLTNHNEDNEMIRGKDLRQAIDKAMEEK